jgi:hypothetical protein
MHFLTIVVLPPGHTDDIEESVTKMLAPFDENLDIESYVEDGETYWRNPQSFWDWWSIGGRWSGHLSESYDPQKDPRNWERCDLCDGTGERAASGLRDGEPWCNACTGSLEDTGRKGWRVMWPTQWVSDTGNVARLGDVRPLLEGSGRPHHLVHEGVTSSERYNPDGEGYDGGPNSKFVNTSDDVIEAVAKLSDDCTVVVVDVHS